MKVMMRYNSSSEIFGGRIPGYPTLSSISSLFDEFVQGLPFNNLEPPPVTKMYQRKRKRNLTVSSDELQDDTSSGNSEDSQSCSKRLKVETKEEGVTHVQCDSPVSSDSEVVHVKMGEAENSRLDEPKAEALNEVTKREEIKAHLLSLLPTTMPMHCSNNERVCQFCESGKLLYAATPMYCSNCSCRIKEKVNYYSTPTEHGEKYSFCARCYNNSRSLDISFGNIKVSKATLEKKKNEEEIQEPWVRCDRCEGWQHQICALYNDKCDSEEYVCLKCVLKEMEFGDHKPKNVGLCAKDLPTTKLSDHIEKRLAARLEQERQERRSKDKENESSAVLGVEGLVVREVLSVEKRVKVKQQYLDMFPDQSYPAEFPYKLKVILMFQKIDGVDVCIFGMYVQEFSSECGYCPNRGCVYISYLDSVKYFVPAEARTVTGEALRTFVYHEVLIGYLEFCKKQGFVTAYIWSCPPSREEDYILYCHPPMQKTPLPVKLRKWYQSMTKKASNEGIVVGTTNLYDRYFITSSSGECYSKVTASRLPHFDGDYWSSTAEDLIKEISKEEETKIRRRTLEAMGHTKASDGSTKDILLMQKLGDTILSNRESFMVVDLHYVCIRCNKAMLSGEHWSCSQCKNLHLCEKCHSLSGGKDTHMSVDMEQHVLSRVTVLEDYKLPDTKDGEVILNNSLFEERTSFLNFCVKNHYQFDTLRQAKYSSLMILHHLSDLTALTSTEKNETCSSINRLDTTDQSLVCEIEHDKGSPPATKIGKERQLTEGLSRALIKELLLVLKHAALCYPTKNQPCSYPNTNCRKIKRLFVHAKKCRVRASGGCQQCKKAWLGLILHSRVCKESNCSVPRCMDLRKHTDQQGQSRDGTTTHKVTEVSSCSSQTLLPTEAQWLPEVGIWAAPYIVLPF